MEERICENNLCGAAFTVPYRSDRKRFCKGSCTPQKQPKYPIKIMRRCKLCNEPFIFTASNPQRRRTRVSCSKECAIILCSPFKWDESEIYYLAILNKGIGIGNFANNLWPNNSYERKQMLFSLFGEIKEETGLDLYAYLQDPDHMQTKHWTEFNRLPKGYSFGPLHRMKKSPKRIILTKYNKIKVAPKFNWGELKHKVPGLEEE